MTTLLHPIDDHDAARWPAPYAGMLAVALVVLAVVGLLIELATR